MDAEKPIKNPVVSIATSLGEVRTEIFLDKAPIKNEAANGLKNNTGTLAMARTAFVDSATAQFFINVKDNDFLNHQNTSAEGFGYAVFGRVIEGMEVVQKIEKVKTGAHSTHQNVPVEPVVIQSMRIVS